MAEEWLLAGQSLVTVWRRKEGVKVQRLCDENLLTDTGRVEGEKKIVKLANWPLPGERTIQYNGQTHLTAVD